MTMVWIDYTRFNFCRTCGAVVAPKSVLLYPRCGMQLRVVPQNHESDKSAALAAFDRARNAPEAPLILVDRERMRRRGG